MLCTLWLQTARASDDDFVYVSFTNTAMGSTPYIILLDRCVWCSAVNSGGSAVQWEHGVDQGGAERGGRCIAECPPNTCCYPAPCPLPCRPRNHCAGSQSHEDLETHRLMPLPPLSFALQALLYSGAGHQGQPKPRGP